MTGNTVIGLPAGVHTADRIDPRTLLTGWADAEIDSLLRTGLFDEIVWRAGCAVRISVRDIVGRAAPFDL